MIFPHFVPSEIFRKFYVFQFRLVFRYGILYKSVDMIGTSVMKELTTLNGKFYRSRRQERIISHDISVFISVSTNGWKSHLV